MISLQQQALNAFGKHLENYLGEDVIVSNRWPSAEQSLPPKMVSIIYAGPRIDIPLPPSILRIKNKPDPKIDVTYQLRACEQPIQLDVWARRDVDRDDLIARLDDILNMGLPGIDAAENGVIVQVDKDTFADFYFDSPNNIDTVNSAMQSEFRTTYPGSLYFMLTVTRETARQKLINLKVSLSNNTDYNTITIE